MLLTAAIYLFCQMCIVWLIANRLKNPSVVDVAWSIGITVTAGIYLFSTAITERNILIFTLASFWSIRLSAYLYLTRVRKGEVDKRYVTMSESWRMRRSLGYFLNFQLQAILSWIIAIVFIFPGKSVDLSISTLDIISAMIVIIGIIGESIADQQLLKFKQMKMQGVCNIGLWQYTRHPNYFFEWIVWCGFCLFALQSAFGCYALLSPTLLYIILNYITGPMTERGSIASRGDTYRTYMKETPMFWPKLSK